jgi:hypothetical protein
MTQRSLDLRREVGKRERGERREEEGKREKRRRGDLDI